MWYLIRHPQTVLNLERKYHGWGYAPYSSLGKKQFQAILQYVEKLPVDSIYSSDLDRCLVLAKKIHQNLQIPLHIFTELRELNFGKWHGNTYNHLNAEYSFEMKKWLENPWDNAPVGGETLAELHSRCLHFKEFACNTNSVIITHGGVIATFLQIIKNEEYWKLLPKNSDCVAIDWTIGKSEIFEIPLNYSKQA